MYHCPDLLDLGDEAVRTALLATYAVFAIWLLALPVWEFFTWIAGFRACRTGHLQPIRSCSRSRLMPGRGRWVWRISSDSWRRRW